MWIQQAGVWIQEAGVWIQEAGVRIQSKCVDPTGRCVDPRGKRVNPTIPAEVSRLVSQLGITPRHQDPRHHGPDGVQRASEEGEARHVLHPVACVAVGVPASEGVGKGVGKGVGTWGRDRGSGQGVGKGKDGGTSPIPDKQDRTPATKRVETSPSAAIIATVSSDALPWGGGGVRCKRVRHKRDSQTIKTHAPLTSALPTHSPAHALTSAL